MTETKKEKNQTRRDFLLTFFDKSTDGYQEQFVNGFWLIRQISGYNDKPIVAIYTEESFKRYQEAKKNYSLFSMSDKS